MDESASFSQVEIDLAAHYRPDTGSPVAVRQYTHALLWCRNRLATHELHHHDPDALAKIVLVDWARRYVPGELLERLTPDANVRSTLLLEARHCPATV